MVVGSAVVFILLGMVGVSILGYRWYSNTLLSAYGELDPITLRIGVAAGACFVVGLLLLIVGLRRPSPTPPSTPAPSTSVTAQTHAHVTWVYPNDHSIDVGRNSKIVIAFDEPIDTSTLAKAASSPQQRSVALEPKAMRLEPLTAQDTRGASVGLTARWNQERNLLVLDPAALLGTDGRSIMYELSIDGTVKTAKGDPVVPHGGRTTWHFTVGPTVDTTAPRLLSVFPSPQSTVDRNAIVQLVFSKAMDPLPLVDADGVSVIGPSSKTVEGERVITPDLRVVEFVPVATCAMNQCGKPVGCFDAHNRYSISLGASSDSSSSSTAFHDINGNVFDASASFSQSQQLFSTTDRTTMTAPAIARVSPRLNASGVSANEPVKLVFDQLLRLSTVNDDTAYIPGSVSWVSERAAGDGATTSITVDHDPWTENIVASPVVTSSVQSVYQACFLPCQGP